MKKTVATIGRVLPQGAVLDDMAPIVGLDPGDWRDLYNAPPYQSPPDTFPLYIVASGNRLPKADFAARS